MATAQMFHVDNPADRLRKLITPRLSLLGAAGWIATQHAVQQFLRLGTNVVLARLLSPELLGTMLLINTFRTGGELLTDVGIGQSIVSNPKGAEPVFYNTAWTAQIIRGALLFVIGLAAAYPLAAVYDEPQFRLLLPVAALVFLISGFTSPSKFLLQKDMKVKRLALLGMGMGVTSSIFHISLALYTPTIWALIIGLLASTLGGTISSFFLIDWRIHFLVLDRSALHSMMHFGKWVFVSSLIYFAAMNFDRLYFADVVPFSLLGVYGIARTFSDSIMQLFLRFSRLMIFPKVAAARGEIKSLRRRITRLRRLALVVMALGLALLVAVSDQFIFHVYDERYRDAAIFLPILLMGTWFSILSAAGEAMLLGIGKSSGVAAANGAKLVLIVVSVPVLLPSVGIVGATIAYASADGARYAVLVWRKRGHGLSFLRQDFAATALFFLAIIVFREFTHLAGLTDSMSAWLRGAHGQIA